MGGVFRLGAGLWALHTAWAWLGESRFGCTEVFTGCPQPLNTDTSCGRLSLPLDRATPCHGLGSVEPTLPSPIGAWEGLSPVSAVLGAERRSPGAGGCGSVLLGLGLGECPHTEALLRQLLSSQGPDFCTSASPRARRVAPAGTTLKTVRNSTPRANCCSDKERPCSPQLACGPAGGNFSNFV